jgi:hypothetical protein
MKGEKMEEQKMKNILILLTALLLITTSAQAVLYIEDFEEAGTVGFDPLFNHNLTGSWELVTWQSLYGWLALYLDGTDEVTFNTSSGEYVDWAGVSVRDFAAGDTNVTFIGTLDSVRFEYGNSGGLNEVRYFDTTGLNLGNIQMVRLGGAGESFFDDLKINVVGLSSGPMPDLIDLGELYRSFEPRTMQAGVPGQTLEIHSTIGNAGSENSNPCKIRFYASTDTHIAASDYVIGHEGSIRSLAPRQALPFRAPREFPTNIPAGSYYVGWIIDADNEVQESDETNNTAYKQGYMLTVTNGSGLSRNIDITPKKPTSCDVVVITVSGVDGNSCIPTGSATSIVGNVIYFDLIYNYPPGTPCAMVLTPFEQTQTIGQLPPNDYSVRVRIAPSTDVYETADFVVSPCLEPSCCDPPYSPGDRVKLKVNSPFGAVGLLEGAIGTVICCHPDEPARPIFVCWDGWAGGKNPDPVCDTGAWPYEENSGWWVACYQIEPCLEDCYPVEPDFDECGVLVQGTYGVPLFEADAGGLYYLDNYSGFGVGDRVHVRGVLEPRCALIFQETNGCIFHTAIQPCPEDDCCHPPYSLGDRVILLVDNPNQAVGLPAGTYGTVLCCDSTRLDRRIFVSWDGWNNGLRIDQHCDILPPGRYILNSGRWMACDQIGHCPDCPPIDVPAPLEGCCDPPLSPGDRVILLANNPFGALDLIQGATGTVICCDSDDPQRPIFVSWDDWTEGKSNDQFCHTSVWPYQEDSGWWVACSQIAKYY